MSEVNPSREPSKGISFIVDGEPRPQGSKRARLGPDGKIWMYEASGKNLKDWREAITWAAKLAMKGRPTFRGPVEVAITFYLKHPSRGPEQVWPLKRPDVDKLQRAILDGMADAKVMFDDSQVCVIRGQKAYARPGKDPCAVVQAWEIET